MKDGVLVEGSNTAIPLRAINLGPKQETTSFFQPPPCGMNMGWVFCLFSSSTPSLIQPLKLVTAALKLAVATFMSLSVLLGMMSTANSRFFT